MNYNMATQTHTSRLLGEDTSEDNEIKAHVCVCFSPGGLYHLFRCKIARLSEPVKLKLIRECISKEWDGGGIKNWWGDSEDTVRMDHISALLLITICLLHSRDVKVCFVASLCQCPRLEAHKHTYVLSPHRHTLSECITFQKAGGESERRI